MKSEEVNRKRREIESSEEKGDGCSCHDVVVMRALYARTLMGSFGSEKWGGKRGNGAMELEARSDCMLKSTRGKKIRSVSLQPAISFLFFLFLYPFVVLV